ncbi:MAG: glycosyltransferase family 2 protein [Thaumarchaeota archaeon]|nr:glycosyltransferase family 2 protein [Nitrososphaerota archaeon]MDD9843023.1 glycosyltransferase family 2 protein [Nitrososphaerota archaeon]
MGKTGGAQVSIIIPTYNEAPNILDILRSIREHVSRVARVEAIVVDDGSPDGTAGIVREYMRSEGQADGYSVDIVQRRQRKAGLSSAILHGVRRAAGSVIVVMDSDFSHPPQVIPKMLEALRHQCDIVVASRYMGGGGVVGWPLRRRVASRVATAIARIGLGVEQSDPMSGFFAFRRSVVRGLDLDAIGYKLLLEVLVKARGARIKEIPYTFTDRAAGSSKLGIRTVIDYARSVWRLYRGGARRRERRASVRFASKAARFYTVGALGLGVNWLVSMLFAGGGGLWYIHANIAGIAASVATNFVLNKRWTFEDTDFGARRTLSQGARFAAISSLGAAVQLGAVYMLVEHYAMPHAGALVLAVAAASLGNFVLNKTLTFRERLWS